MNTDTNAGPPLTCIQEAMQTKHQKKYFYSYKNLFISVATTFYNSLKPTNRFIANFCNLLLFIFFFFKFPFIPHIIVSGVEESDHLANLLPCMWPRSLTGSVLFHLVDQQLEREREARKERKAGKEREEETEREREKDWQGKSKTEREKDRMTGKEGEWERQKGWWVLLIFTKAFVWNQGMAWLEEYVTTLIWACSGRCECYDNAWSINIIITSCHIIKLHYYLW